MYVQPFPKSSTMSAVDSKNCENLGSSFLSALVLIKSSFPLLELPSFAAMSSYQFTAFEVGQIKAHMYHELGATAISKILKKPDGKTFWSDTAIQGVIDKLENEPKWRGDRKEGSGAPRKTTEKQDAELVKVVEDNRGKVKVTVAWLRTKFSWTRNLGNTALEQRLHDAGLAFLRRRKKALVPRRYLKDRIRYCWMVMNMHYSTLLSWAYSDGTVFYLDRSVEENESTQRRALGSHVWRQADRSDAMYFDCIGPSSYSKAQGIPVRVWGVLANGILNIHVLEQGEVMNGFLYTELIEDYFPRWLGHCIYLVQDFEKCLHGEEPMAAFADIGVQLVPNYPKCSQDFNAIENAWKLLRDRLDQTLPLGVEDREHFVGRLHAAVAWINRNKQKELQYYSTNQKERAKECLNSKPKGSRTKF